MRVIKFRVWNGEYMCFDYEMNCCSWDTLTDGRDAMQFTGLVDKNGKDIYESDILRSCGVILKVYWSEKFTAFRLKEDTGEDTDCIFWCLEKFEVIGNIHESPELLNEPSAQGG